MFGIDQPRISSSSPETEDDEAHLFYHSNTSCDPDTSERHSDMDMLWYGHTLIQPQVQPVFPIGPFHSTDIKIGRAHV